MMWDWSGNAGWADWAAMGLMMFVTAAVVAIVVWAVAWSLRPSSSHRSFETPHEALNRRLATGEIDEDQYTRARRLIEGHVSQTG